MSIGSLFRALYLGEIHHRATKEISPSIVTKPNSWLVVSNIPAGTAGITKHWAVLFLPVLPWHWISPWMSPRLMEGAHITVVVSILVFDPSHEAHLIRLSHSGVKCLFSGLIDGGYQSYTLCDAVMGKQFPIPVLGCDGSTKVICHPCPSWQNMRCMIDGCCGIGGISHGAQAVGITTTVAVDANALMTGLHGRHSDAEMIVGDLGDLDVIKQIGLKADGAKILSAGFNCQPFSSLGDGRGGSDPRAQSLPKALKAAYFLQVRIVLLECVTPAKEDAFVVQTINHFLEVTGFKQEQVDLHLHEVWPCRRSRSWWLLYDPFLGHLGLTSWPTLKDLPAVKCLIPYISRWDPRDELALSLDQIERTAFGIDDETYSRYLLSSEGTAPTALHAWGSQLRACPCGCRSHALSERRLAEKGLFGLLVQSQSDVLPSPGIRHVHPNEALALNAMDCTIDFGLSVRLSLSGVGQIASPLQAAWVLSFVTARLEIMCNGDCQFSPESQLWAFRSWLIMRCQLTWPCNECMISEATLKALVSFWHEHPKLSISQLVHPSTWPDLPCQGLTIAAVLDHVIRSCCRPNPSWVLPPIDEPETPWFDEIVCDPKCDFSLSVGVSTITLIDTDGSCLDFGFVAGSTVANFLEAHGKLNGIFRVATITDGLGSFISPDVVIERGQQIQVFLAHGPDGLCFPSDDCSKVTGPICPDDASVMNVCPHEVSGSDPVVVPASVEVFALQGESGLLPKLPEDQDCGRPQGVHDTEPDPSATGSFPASWHASHDSFLACPSGHGLLGNANALLALTEQQFLRLTVPSAESTDKLASLRCQLVKSSDRVKLLDVQQTLWSDDEITFHLNQILLHLQQSSDASETLTLPLVVDPILMTAWLHDRGFSIAHWASTHPEVLDKKIQIIGVGCVDGHWIPFQIVPCGSHANIFTWDAPQHEHGKLNHVLEEITKHLGFSTTLINRQQRMFFMSGRCGALAIHFLHNVVHGTMLPITPSEANIVHETLRGKFAKAVALTEFVVRPWIWGSGETDDESPVDEVDVSLVSRECWPLPRLPTSGVGNMTPAMPSWECGPLPIMPVQPSADMPPASQGWETISCALGLAPFTCETDGLGPFDIGVRPPRCSSFVISSQLPELLQMDSQQMKMTPPPCIPDPTALWLIRHQVILVRDRLSVLPIQFGVWADDEIRFHLQCVCKQLNSSPEALLPGPAFALDPLVCSTWLDPQSCSGESWARSHPDILQQQITVCSAFRIDGHWVPVILFPAGTTVCIITSDFDQWIAPKLVNVLHRLVVALGFQEITFDHEARGFSCRSVCGAIAINFLQHRLLQMPKITTYAAAWGAHAMFRHQFVQMMQDATLVPRPWLWASGDEEGSEKSEKSWKSEPVPANEPGESSTGRGAGVPLTLFSGEVSSHCCIPIDDRIELFRAHGTAMGDDEIRFHLFALQSQRYKLQASSAEKKPDVICFESLNFLQWDDVGHILTEKWCVGFPQV